MRRHTQIALAGVALTALCIGVLQGGPLNPPAGPVASTGPTQILELPYTISQPGSYVVVRDLTGVTGESGITIAADGVTLDLGGFTLHGVSGSLDGITMGTFLENVVIQNGAVRDWGGHGVHAQITAGRIERISAANNGLWGIYNAGGTYTSHIVSCEVLFNGSGGAGGGIMVSHDAVITGCVARSNSGTGILGNLSVTVEDTTSDSNNNGPGFQFGEGAVIRGCTANSNAGGGIVAGNNVTIENTTSKWNTGAGFLLQYNAVITGCSADSNTGGGGGIIVGNNSTISECSVQSNASNGVAGGNNVSIETTTSSNNNGAGFLLGYNAVITGCSADSNTGPGVSAAGGCTVENTTSTSNLGPGFVLSGTVRGCTATGNMAPQPGQAPPPGFVDPFADYVDPVVIDKRTGKVIPGLVSFGGGTEGVSLGSDGFRLGMGSTIEGCTANGNADDGIVVGFGSTVVNCTTLINAGDGVIADDDSTVRSCTSRSNGGAGFVVDLTSAIRDCTSQANADNGITASAGTTIVGNAVGNNSYGIRVFGVDSTIDGNSLVNNFNGGIVLNAGGGLNLVVRNDLSLSPIIDNGNNNHIGPLNDMTSPWANFSD